MEEEEYYRLLVRRYTDGTATNKELEVFISLANEGKLDKYLTEAISEVAGITEENKQAIYVQAKVKSLWPRIAAAAAVLFVISTGAYFLLHNRTIVQQTAVVQSKGIIPGHNQATLTLANGQKIILSKGLSGTLAQQGNTKINVTGAKEVVYSQSGEAAAITYNTMSTAVGEASPYPLVLADGTKVWLNSKSSIKFPTAFNGNKREVEIIGEAYFEVVHNASNPFTVKAGNQIVEDIGTAFNINSYGDEPNIKTTLVRGSAKVSANGIDKILVPGQHSLVTSQSIVLQDADSEAETAWINNKFIFHSLELHNAMRQLSRWYNIKVIYDYNPKNVLLGGRFSNTNDINKLLKAFEQTGAVKFKIEGHDVHVTE